MIYQKGGDIRVCSIGQFFGYFNLNCGIAVFSKPAGWGSLRLVDDSHYKNVSLTFFRPFLAVSGRFEGILKHP